MDYTNEDNEDLMFREPLPEDSLKIKFINLSMPLNDIYADTGLDGKPQLKIVYY